MEVKSLLASDEKQPNYILTDYFVSSVSAIR